jgi:hypothetical protein
MKRWNVVVALLVLVGLMAAPAYADMRLSVTGFVDNHIRYTQNLSPFDDNLTNGTAVDTAANPCRGNCDDENDFRGRTRARIFFNLAANEFSKAVVGFEIDQVWGRVGTTGQVGQEGFDLGTDNIVAEVKWAYIDAKIPGTPVSFRLGGFDFKADRLKGSCTLLCIDAGGIDIEIAFDPQVILSVYFSNTEEDDDRIVTASRIGDDYFTGFTLMTIPYKGLKANLIFAFQHIEGASTTAALRIGSTGQTSEDRFFIGVEAEWKMGNFTFSPTFIYGGGSRKFATASASDIDISTFVADIRGAVVFGPLTVTGKFVYTPGNESSDSLAAGGSDINYWQSIAVDTVHRPTEWFELFGFNIDSTSPAMFTLNDSRSVRSNLSFDQFGLIHGAIRVDYKATNTIVVTGALGFFAAAEDVGSPSAGRAGVSQGNGRPLVTRNYTGEDTYLATELDVWLRYALYKNADLDVWFAHAFVGDALDLCADATGPGTGVACVRSSAQDVTAAGARILYRF